MRSTHRVLGVILRTDFQRKIVQRKIGCLCGNDTVTKRPGLSHEACRLSCGRIDGVEAVRHRVDAIAATTSC